MEQFYDDVAVVEILLIYDEKKNWKFVFIQKNYAKLTFFS